jgi:surface antigen
VAGVIIGGALGGAMTSHMDCQDRSYAYKTYYDGFNSGRPNSNWQWDNPGDGDYGDFRVGDYYTDPGGFRCATFTQQIYVRGQPEVASGHACQQPDGAWAIVN